MISGISSSSNYNYLTTNSVSSNSSSSSALTSSQQQTLDQILSQYDPTSLTKNDAQQIVQALQDAGINPSKSLEEAMETSGFDAAQIGQLAGLPNQNQAQNGMPPPPAPSKDEQENILSLIESLFSNSSNSNSGNTFDNLFSNSNNSSSTTSAVSDTTASDSTSSTNFVDMVSDYTSRVLNLNDNAKQSVMDLFDKYSNQNSSLSAQDSATVIKTQLSQILGDSSNYNHSYMYA